VEGKSRKSDKELKGRSDTNKRVIIPDMPITNFQISKQTNQNFSDNTIKEGHARIGDYVVVEIERASGLVLIGKPLAITTQADFWNNHQYWTQAKNERTL